jgi:hypothetical protein
MNPEQFPINPPSWLVTKVKGTSTQDESGVGLEIVAFAALKSRGTLSCEQAAHSFLIFSRPAKVLILPVMHRKSLHKQSFSVGVSERLFSAFSAMSGKGVVLGSKSSGIRSVGREPGTSLKPRIVQRLGKLGGLSCCVAERDGEIVV